MLTATSGILVILLASTAASEGQEHSWIHRRKKTYIDPSVKKVFDFVAYTAWGNWTNCEMKNCYQYRVRRCHSNYLYKIGVCSSMMPLQRRRCCRKKRRATFTSSPTISPPDKRQGYLFASGFLNGGSNQQQFQCGARASYIETNQMKVIGGKTSQPNSWPWMVALMDLRKKKHFCGGTLIHPQFVLTAAHCVLHYDQQTNQFTGFHRNNLGIKLGDNRRATGHRRWLLRPKKIVYHLAFNPRQVTYDVALIQLERSVLQSQFVNFACLPNKTEELAPHTVCVVTGWGFKGRRKGLAAELQEARVNIRQHSFCQSQYSYRTLDKRIHLCAGGFGRDTCHGDSGGPLMCPVPDAAGRVGWTVFGITSFGHMAGCGHTSGIYTKVSQVKSWIMKVISRYTKQSRTK